MRLSDFLLSTSNLDANLKLNQKTTTSLLPLSDIALDNHKIILLSNPDLACLTLDQFRARCSNLPAKTRIYVSDVDHPIFGYRLDQQNIIIG